MISLEMIDVLLAWLILLTIDPIPGPNNKLHKKLVYYTQSLLVLVKELTKNNAMYHTLKNKINTLSKAHNMLILELQSCCLRERSETELKLFLTVKDIRFPVYSVTNNFFIPDHLFVENKTQTEPLNDINVCDSKDDALRYFRGIYSEFNVKSHSEFYDWFNTKINESNELEVRMSDNESFRTSIFEDLNPYYGFLFANTYDVDKEIGACFFTLNLEIDGKNRILSCDPGLYEFLTPSERSYFEAKIKKKIKHLMIQERYWRQCSTKNCYFHKKPFFSVRSDGRIGCPNNHVRCVRCGRDEHEDSCENFKKFDERVESIFEEGFSEPHDRRDFYPWNM